LGRGACAKVYEARSPSGELGAVKVLHAELTSQRRWRERFARETRLFGEITAQGLPRKLDEGTSALGCPFVVLERLAGRSLAEILERDGVVELSEALDWADSLLATLAEIHAHGVLHRDIKPSNLLLTTDGQLKVLDLGIAAEALRTRCNSLATRGLLGTPAYMAPEQARGRWDLVDARSDLWSAAAVLFTLLSGEHVHTAETDNEQLALAISCPARSISSLRADLAPELASVIDRALSYDANRRYASAAEFRAALCAPSARLTPLGSRGDITQCSTLTRTPVAPALIRREWTHAPQLVLLTAGLAALLLASSSAQSPLLTPRVEQTPVADAARGSDVTREVATPRVEILPAISPRAAETKPTPGTLPGPRRSQSARGSATTRALPASSLPLLVPADLSPLDERLDGHLRSTCGDHSPCPTLSGNPLDQRM